MYGIWLKRLGRAAAVTAIAGAATLCVGTAAEARNDGYWGHPYYHHWAYRDWRYSTYYAPRYYYAPPAYAYSYRAPAYAYSYEPTYYPPAINFTIPLR